MFHAIRLGLAAFFAALSLWIYPAAWEEVPHE
jgi:hypothetical protein